MNIFILDLDQQKAAEYHCDKHVIKMITETAQILSTVLTYYKTTFVSVQAMLYKPTHVHHPCTKWAAQEITHFVWTTGLLEALINEYDYRFGKPNRYESARSILKTCKSVSPNEQAVGTPRYYSFAGPDTVIHEVTGFKAIMPYHPPNTAVGLYRNYYKNHKQHLHKWTKREIPHWLV